MSNCNGHRSKANLAYLPALKDGVSHDKPDDSDTPTHHRLKLPLKAGDTTKVTARLEHQKIETYALANAEPAFLFSILGNAATPELRRLIMDIGEQQEKRTDLERQIKLLDTTLQDERQRHERIRSDLSAIPEGNKDLTDTYLAKLQESEAKLSSLEAKRQELRNAAARVEEKINDILSGS